MELSFPQDEQRNVMIVFGDNMRGKTSILNAIRWAFLWGSFGSPLAADSPSGHCEQRGGPSGRLEGGKSHVKFDANGYAYDLRRVADRRQLVATPSKPEDFTMSIHLARDGSVVAGDQVEIEIGLVAPKQIARFLSFRRGVAPGIRDASDRGQPAGTTDKGSHRASVGRARAYERPRRYPDNRQTGPKAAECRS